MIHWNFSNIIKKLLFLWNRATKKFKKVSKDKISLSLLDPDNLKITYNSDSKKFF